MKNEIKIFLAAPRGFCAGVDRAIEIVKKTLNKYGSPVYVRHEGGIVIYPTTGYANVDITYIRKPAEPQWKGGTLSGQIVKNESDGAYQNFELHSSEFPELVIRILTYAGVSIRAADITQAATVKEQQIIQSER